MSIRFVDSCRWEDQEELFEKSDLVLSEIFWEGVENMMEKIENLVTGDITKSFMEDVDELY